MLSNQFLFKTKKAFTMIEIMIVVSMMLTLSTVTISQLKNTKDSQSIEIAARQVLSDIRKAQLMALDGRIIENSTGEEIVACAYGIHFKWDQGKYEFVYINPTDSKHNPCRPFLSSQGEKITKESEISLSSFDNNLHFTNNPEQSWVWFKVPLGLRTDVLSDLTFSDEKLEEMNINIVSNKPGLDLASKIIIKKGGGLELKKILKNDL